MKNFNLVASSFSYFAYDLDVVCYYNEKWRLRILLTDTPEAIAIQFHKMSFYQIRKNIENSGVIKKVGNNKDLGGDFNALRRRWACYAPLHLAERFITGSELYIALYCA